MNFIVTQRRSQVSPFELVASDSLVAYLLPKISDLSIAETNVTFKASVKLYFFSKIVVMNLEHLHLLDLNLSLKFFFIRFHYVSKNLRATEVLFFHS